MKKLFVVFVLTLFTTAAFSQPLFDLGIKGGLTNADFTLDTKNFTSESIQSYHVGAFGRIGWDRFFIQPEAYFNSRGGNIHEVIDPNPINTVTNFDYSTVDIPLLVGVKLLKMPFFNFRAQGGPLFSFITSKEVRGDIRFEPEFFKDNFCGWQYGVGVDLWMFTLDARIENSRTNVYQSSDLNTRSKTFLISAGIKIF